MFGFFKKKQLAAKADAKEQQQVKKRTKAHDDNAKQRAAEELYYRNMQIQAAHEKFNGRVGAMDSACGAVGGWDAGSTSLARSSVMNWYASQDFIGYQNCAHVAQGWFVNKACNMPARDAVRQGYTAAGDFGDNAQDIKDMLLSYDKKFKLNKQMVDYVHFGRVFGIRIALFKVDSTDPLYYEKPFNPDGVTAASYKGIVQVDADRASPLLDGEDALSPDSLHFYEPTFWLIGGRRYHRSHLCIFIPVPVPNYLKPSYRFGGMSIPQLMAERVYAAERVAGEAPMLVMTKRTLIYGTNMQDAAAQEQSTRERIEDSVRMWNNFGVHVMDSASETMQQIDTNIAGLDEVIMTQYQIAAAQSSVPATKILGTQPKGFNSTGEYEEACYREELESIQANDLTPFLNRHHMLVMRSYIAPKLNIEPVDVDVVWEALDSQTAKEVAEIAEIKSRTDMNLFNTGAIDQSDIRERLISDEEGGYSSLAPVEFEEDDEDEVENGQVSNSPPRW